MSTKTDYYELLTITRDANGDEVKRAYRKLAMQYHPDKNPGDKSAEVKFREITEAYEVLSDEQKRAAYDRYGHAAFEQGGAGGMGGGFDFNGFPGGLSDILNEVFGDFMGAAAGGGRSSNGAQRGNDVRYDLELTLEEAFKGAEKTIKVATPQTCETCKGSGAKPGTSPATCKQCSGAGKVRIQQGFFLMERACPVCAGAGKVIEHACKDCRGQGRVRNERTLKVTVPAGVDTGTRIRITGEGEAGMRGGAQGDLYVFISVKPHAFLHREGANLLARMPISFVLAALGGTIEVPTLDGAPATLNIPEGAQNGQQFRLKGQGMTTLQQGRVRNENARGDLFVEVSIETPVHLSPKQKQLLEEFDTLTETKKNNPVAHTFLERVKGFFAKQASEAKPQEKPQEKNEQQKQSAK
ncbi:MAG: molecular chaperone DnaJ [Alphaproteobacteria bacterium]|nr:molecular chaperone DnaJ [Alphaproteobacteria bacterium]